MSAVNNTRKGWRASERANTGARPGSTAVTTGSATRVASMEPAASLGDVEAAVSTAPGAGPSLKASPLKTTVEAKAAANASHRVLDIHRG